MTKSLFFMLQFNTQLIEFSFEMYITGEISGICTE